MSPEVQDLVRLAESSESSDCVDAATRLARSSDGTTRSILERLLNDHGGAVIVAAAEAVLQRNDLYGAELYAEALASADDDVGDDLVSLLPALWHGDGLDIPGLLRRVEKESVSLKARQGAKEALESLRIGSDS